MSQLATVDPVDFEIKRRQRNRRGQFPDRFPDAFGRYAPTPWGAIVDGYQLIDGTWHRIDRADDIDLEAFRDSSAALARATAADAERIWRESIGELDRTEQPT